MNCKATDHAIVIYTDSGEGIGMLVSVDSFCGLVQGLECLGPIWHCTSLGSPGPCGDVLPLSGGGYMTVHKRLSMEFLIPDAWLRPLLPDEREDMDVDQLELTE